MSKKSVRSDQPRFKVIIDTNLWISFIISSRQEEFTLLVLENDIAVYTCQELIDEMREVLERDKIRKYLKLPVEEYISFHKSLTQKFTPKPSVSFGVDPKDSFLLNLSIETRADFLITGDKALLSMGTVESTQIISYTQFKRMLK